MDPDRRIVPGRVATLVVVVEHRRLVVGRHHRRPVRTVVRVGASGGRRRDQQDADHDARRGQLENLGHATTLRDEPAAQVASGLPPIKPRTSRRRRRQRRLAISARFHAIRSGSTVSRLLRTVIDSWSRGLIRLKAANPSMLPPCE